MISSCVYGWCYDVISTIHSLGGSILDTNRGNGLVNVSGVNRICLEKSIGLMVDLALQQRWLIKYDAPHVPLQFHDKLI